MTTPPESGMGWGEVLRLRSIAVKLEGAPVFTDVNVIITLEDKPSILNRDEKVTVEFEAKTKQSYGYRTPPERFKNFYIRDSEEAMLRIRPKIIKWGRMHLSRSEHWSQPIEINGEELHSRCYFLAENHYNLIELVLTIPPIDQKYNIIINLHFQRGRPDASDLSDCVKLLEEQVEKKESVMDKLGCVGRTIDILLMYGRPLSEMNSFAKAAFALADKLFMSIKIQDECKEEACNLIRRTRDTLEEAQKLQKDPDTFGDIINRILTLVEETIQIISEYDGGFATELGRATISPMTMLDRLKCLNHCLDEISTRLNQVIGAHVLENTKRIRVDVAEIHGAITEIHDGVAEIRRKLEDHSRRGDLEKICKWLSDMEFAAFPVKMYGASHEGSGEWFTESKEFVEWKTGRSRLLWCSGIPGSGKTTMSAIVLKHLRSIPHLLESNCLLNIYCRHDLKSKQSVSSFLRCLWAQLASQRDFVSKNLAACYDRFTKYRVDPSPDELVEAVMDEFNSFPIVYIVVDGLDECGDDAVLEEFATKLKELGRGQNTRLLVTSRPYPNIKWILMPEFRSYTLIANRDDMERFIEKRFEYPKSFGRMVDSSTLISREMITDIVIDRAGGMFLLVRLHMGNLQALGSAQAIRDRLDRLANLDTSDDERAAKVLNHAYDDTMKRIKEHPFCEPAMKLLLWIVYVQKPQTIGALRYAITTIKPYDKALNDDDLTDEDGLISACAGLISVNREVGEKDTVRVVHETTEVYLRRIFGSSSSCHALLMNQCLRALSLPPPDSLCELGLLDGNPSPHIGFLGYASAFWNIHACNADEASEYRAMEFLKRTVNQKAFGDIGLFILFYSTHANFCDDFYVKVRAEYARPSHIHLAALFGFHRALGKIELEGTSMNMIMDRARRTPLTYAVIGKAIESVRLFLKNPSVDLNWRNVDGKTPLVLAIESREERIVKLLLDQEHINCDCFHVDGFDWIDPIFASSVVQQLYERDDADPSPVLRYCWHLLPRTQAMSEMVQAILETEPETAFPINWQDEYGTALWSAVQCGCYDTTVTLLECGSDPWIAKDRWQSPLLLAVDLLLNEPTPEREDIFFVLLKHLCKDRIIEEDRFSFVLDFIESQPGPVLEMIPIPAAAAWVLGGNHPGTCITSTTNKEDLLRQTRTALVTEILYLLGINLNVIAFDYPQNSVQGLVDPSNGRTVLSYAAQSCRTPETVRLLLSQGANLIFHNNNELSLFSYESGHTVDKLKISSRAPISESSIVSIDIDSGRTPLSYAANLDIIRLLVEECDANVNKIDLSGRSILSYAVTNRLRDDEITVNGVHFLLELGADPTSTDLSGRSVLSYAAQDGVTEIIRALLVTLDPGRPFSLAARLGADKQERNVFSYYMGNPRFCDDEIATLLLGEGDINEPDRSGRTPLMYAAEAGNTKAVKWLLSKCAEVGARDREDRSALFHAAMSLRMLGAGNLEPLLLHTSSAGINEIDVYGRSPLSYAAGNTDEEFALKLLTSPRINADGQDVYGRTPLSYSAELGRWEVTVALLARDDVQPNTADYKGRTPLSYAAARSLDTSYPLKGPHVSVGALLDRLTRDGVEFNVEDDNGRTPWSYALEYGNPGTIAEFLLHDREKMRETDDNGRTLLSHAAQEGRVRIVGVFLQFCTPADVNIHDNEGRTAVSYAAEGGYRIITAKLFRAGADLNILDQNGRTPLSYAIERGHTRVMGYLERNGGRLPPPNLEYGIPRLDVWDTRQADIFMSD